MRQVNRSLFPALLILLHAAICLGGPGMHAIPAWSHGSGVTPTAKDDHSHGPGKSSHQVAEECPVCQFLSDRQVSSDPPSIGVGEPFERGVTLPEHAKPIVRSEILENPRAPPFIPSFHAA